MRSSPSQPVQLSLALDSPDPGLVLLGRSASGAAEAEVLTLTWSLEDCDTAAERAGLAALALLVDWSRNQPDCQGTLQGSVDEHTLTLSLDIAGLDYLLRGFYRWETVERRSATKNSAVHRTEEEIDPDTKKTRTIYFWNQDQPVLAFLADPDICAEGGEAWLNLSRELIWRGLYSNKNARGPFYNGIDAASMLANLKENSHQKISGSSLLTAGSTTAEKVEFRTSARQAFLLRFWPLAAQVFVVAEAEIDRSTGRIDTRVRDRRAIAIPDVADLRRFTRQWHKVMRDRPTELRGIYPAAAVIDLPAEAALIGFADFRAVEQMEVGRQAVQVPRALLGFEVIDIEKTSQSPRLHGVTYIAPEPRLLDAYLPLRKNLRHGLLRPQILANAIAGRPLWARTTRLIRLTPLDVTIADAKRDRGKPGKPGKQNSKKAETKVQEERFTDSRRFQMDCNTVTQKNETAQVIRRMLWSYLDNRMTSVGGRTADGIDSEKWNREISRTFVDIRDLSPEKFTAWFSRYLGEFTTASSNGLTKVIDILYADPALCQELTLLCLGSLKDYSKKDADKTPTPGADS